MTNFRYISNIRIMLYNVFYNNTTNINYILEKIVQSFDLFSINYNATTNSITLKIKKTNIRKNSSFSHTAEYYYGVFNPIFYEVFLNNKVLLESIIKENKDKYGLTGDEIDFILDSNNISLLFNITTISDNIVVIYL